MQRDRVYLGVDYQIVWRTVKHDLPALTALLEPIVSRENG